MPYAIIAEQKEAQRRWYQQNKALTQERSNEWKRKNKKKVKAGNRRYAKNNKEKIKERQRRFERRQTAELTDYYIRQELDKHGIPSALSRRMPDLIEATRAYYKMIRLIRKISKDGQ